MAFTDVEAGKRYYKKWRDRNKKWMRNYAASWREKNREKINAASRKRYAKDPKAAILSRRIHPLVCEICGKKFKAFVKTTRFCNRRCMGRAFGGKAYKRWRTPNGIMQEHRYVMEQHLGRKLKKSEVVHHINGDKRDNRVSNLKIFKSTAEHTIFHRKTEPHKYPGGKKC